MLLSLSKVIEVIFSRKMIPRFKPLKMKPKSKSLKAFLKEVLNAVNDLRNDLSDRFSDVSIALKLINSELQATVNQTTVLTDKLKSVETGVSNVETAVGSLARIDET